MNSAAARRLPDQVLVAAETALDLFFETWRLAASEADPVRGRRLRLGALTLVQRVTAIGIEETRAGARARLREARVELRRLVNAGGQRGSGAEGQGGRNCESIRWAEVSTSLGRELSRLNQALCSPEPWPLTESPQPSSLDPSLTTHDSRLATQDSHADS